jgi:hypothetical protein
MSLRIVTGVLSSEHIQSISELPEVMAAREKITRGANIVYFTIGLSEEIKSTLNARLGLDLSAVSAIPMRWIRGDTAPHIDKGASEFSMTHLLYLNDSPGEFIVGNDSYSISKNTAYVFNEGISHKTLNTGSEPRLLLGPMSEAGVAVGAAVYYYPTEADALNDTNSIGFSDYTLETQGGFSSWRIASNSTGSSSQAIVYNTGDTLDSPGQYYLYPSVPCFLEGTTVLCLVDGKEAWKPVESLHKGELVKTSHAGYKKVELIGNGPFSNPGTGERTENNLYKCTKENYPELTEDLVLTGCHSILVDTITDEQHASIIKSLGRIFVTAGKYRLMACLDARTQPWDQKGVYTVWNFALEHEDDGKNYGVYVNGGLLVESCSIRFLRNKSNMTLS